MYNDNCIVQKNAVTIRGHVFTRNKSPHAPYVSEAKAGSDEQGI